jgi:aryl-alcohol dehydrogenase-like predicted oxidoreductase
MRAQHALEQVNDAHPCDGSTDREVDRCGRPDQKRPRRIQPYQIALALKIPGWRRASRKLGAQAGMREQVARVLEPASYWTPTKECVMSNITPMDTFPLAGRPVRRMGYGAMQLAGPGVFGPPRDRNAAIAVLREAVASGVNHIDTSDFYGPHITNQLIREALHPYPQDLVLVTKVGAVRGEGGSWLPALEPQDIRRAVHDNLRNLGLDALDIVNLRIMGDVHAPAEGSIERQVTALAELQQQGLLRHMGLSNVTSAQIAEAQSLAEIVCVQNHYNLVQRADDALIGELAGQGIAYVPFFPLGGFTPIQSSVLSKVAQRIGATPMQTALAWLLHRAPNILLIPGTSSLAHLHENMQAAQRHLPDMVRAELDAIRPVPATH